MKNVMIDGAASPLGIQLAERIAQRDDVQRLFGVEPELTSNWNSRVELIDYEPDHRIQFHFLRDYQIDTVIQCGFAPDRTGDSTSPQPAEVVETMRLGAAIGHAESPVRSWVVLSSSAVYDVDSKRPLLNEEGSEGGIDADSVQSSLLEAESYVEDVARRAPYLNVAILRLQEIVGDGVRGPLASHFDQTPVPRVLGHDPVVQFLHLEDALRAAEFAAELELAGVYNVASNGAVRLSEMLGSAKKQSIPFLPLPTGPLASLAAAAGLPHLPDALLPNLRFGHAVDTEKFEAAGFKPRADQFDCAVLLRA